MPPPWGNRIDKDSVNHSSRLYRDTSGCSVYSNFDFDILKVISTASENDERSIHLIEESQSIDKAMALLDFLRSHDQFTDAVLCTIPWDSAIAKLCGKFYDISTLILFCLI